MKLLMILAVVASCKAQFIFPYMGPMEQRFEDAAGTKGFMYTDWNQNRQEMWRRDGSVVGQYSYIDANSQPVVTQYEAGKQGFRVKSSNLPEAPMAEHQGPLYQAPQPVKDTPEVAEAKRVMADLHHQASTRTKRQVAPQWVYPVKTMAFPLASSYNPYYGSLINPIPMMPASSWITNAKTIEPQAKTRRRREADPALPIMYSMAPAVVNAKIQTKQLTPVEGRTPADTTQLKMTTVEHQIPMAAVPTLGWQAGSPLTYSLIKPAVLPMNIY